MARVPILVPMRGDIWLIDFDPSVGAEIRKIRPAVVISLDTMGCSTLGSTPRGQE